MQRKKTEVKELLVALLPKKAALKRLRNAAGVAAGDTVRHGGGIVRVATVRVATLGGVQR
jgi:hypothetical protein